MTLQKSIFSGQAYNTIALDPNPSQNNPIENATIIDERVISENNSTKTRNLTIWCIARQSNPEPSITVRIGDDIVTNKAGTTIEKKPNVSATGDDDYVSPYYPDFSSKVWKWTNMPLEVTTYSVYSDYFTQKKTPFS